MTNLEQPSVKAAVADWNVHTSRSNLDSRTSWHGDIGRRVSNIVFVDGHAITWTFTPTYESYSQLQAADPANGMY